jgi:WhiB family redox-sensing transcriptional regulator
MRHFATALRRAPEGPDPGWWPAPVDRRRPASAEPIGRRAPLDLPCQSHDPDLWFAENPADLERAKTLCGDCPVRSACLAGALRRREATGVWGGEIVDRGQVVTHKRSPGRPRKDSISPRRYPVLLELV